MRKKVVGALLVTSLTFGGMYTTAFADTAPIADDLNYKVESSIKMKDSLYVIDKENYKQALDRESALLEIRDNLLIVDSEELTLNELQTISTYDKVYILGSAEGELENLKHRVNFELELLGVDRIVNAVEIASNDKERDIIIAHSESFTDGFNAIQLGELEDKNVILIDDEVADEVKVFLEVNGKGKQISFIEGDKIISNEVKDNVLKYAGNSSYEINEIGIVKKGSVSRNVEEKTEVEDIDETNTSNSLIGSINPNIKKKAEVVTEGNKDSLNRADKIISLKLKGNDNPTIIEIAENSESITMYSNERGQFDSVIQQTAEDGESPVHHVIVTNNVPIDTERLKELQNDNGNYHIVPKEINESIIEEVINGEFGNGEERINELTLAGYNYNEIQDEIVQITNEEIKEAQREVERIQNEQEAIRQAANEAREQNELARQTELASSANTNSVNSSNQVNTPAPVVQSTNTPKSTGKSKSTGNSVNTQVVKQDSQANVEGFISELVKMEGSTYSQSKRMQEGYADCSSIILRAMLNSGVTTNSANLTTSSIASDSRFYEVPMNQIKRGDILWSSGHTEVYMGGNSTFGAFKPGKPAGYAGNTNRFSKAYRINVN